MENAPPPTAFATIIFRPPPPFPAPPRSVDLSALEFILGLLAVISIPALIYTFFFAIKCPPDPFRPRRQSSPAASSVEIGRRSTSGAATENTDATTGVKYSKEAHGKEMGGECPVCLSAFEDGDEVKVLSACSHSFHASCIDVWLNSHSNCPVCRASVAVNKPIPTPNNNNNNNNNNRNRTTSSRGNDLHQGLPDAANLV